MTASGARPAESITDPHKQPIIAVFADWGSVGSAFKTFGARVVTVDTANDVERVLRYADAIALTGGGDVDPERYGARPHRNNYGTSVERDAREFAAVEYAKEHGLPMFGICRGLQLLNVAHGGTLDQNIGDNNESFSHEGTHHPIKLRRASRFSQFSGLVGLSGTHLHHQRIGRLGDGLMPVGWAHDGTIEFIESTPNNPNIVVATQFHPEMDYHYDDDAGYIFAHFVRLVSERMRPDVLARWKKVKPRPKATTYGNPTQAGVWVKGQDGQWTRELPQLPSGSQTTTFGHDFYDEDDDARYNNWWNDRKYDSTDDDDEDYMMWERLNTTGYFDGLDAPTITTYDERAECDKRCAFPPCTDVVGCTTYNDCAAETLAKKNAETEEYKQAVAELKRGNGREERTE